MCSLLEQDNDNKSTSERLICLWCDYIVGELRVSSDKVLHNYGVVKL